LLSEGGRRENWADLFGKNESSGLGKRAESVREDKGKGEILSPEKKIWGDGKFRGNASCSPDAIGGGLCLRPEEGSGIKGPLGSSTRGKRENRGRPRPDKDLSSSFLVGECKGGRKAP